MEPEDAEKSGRGPSTSKEAIELASELASELRIVLVRYYPKVGPDVEIATLFEQVNSVVLTVARGKPLSVKDFGALCGLLAVGIARLGQAIETQPAQRPAQKPGVA